MPVQKNKKKHMEAWMLRYVILIKKMLRLSDWTIIMQNEPCSSDCLAETDVITGQHLAKMYLSKTYTKDTPENLRATIIHELLHCHLSPISELSEEILKPLADELGGSRVIKSAINGIEYETERSIDAISEAIAPYFPLPSMPKKKSARKKKVVKKRIVKRKVIKKKPVKKK
jgi:hypothetical protein